MNAEIRFKDKRLLEALEYIDDKYIEDVFNVLKEPDMALSAHKKISPFKHWRQYLTLAACLVLLAFATPIFGYVSEFIGSLAAGIGSDTSSMTESSDHYEETANNVESTEEKETTQKIPTFQYSEVEIVSGGASIKPISVHIGYTWYKDEKSVWTLENGGGWKYIISDKGKYNYQYFPHLMLDGVIESRLPENVTLSYFEVYRPDWERTEYTFENLFELSKLPAGDYIIVGIEKEKIPYEQPHYVVGEYDYKLDRSAIVFALTLTNPTVVINDLEYLKFTTELEEIDYDTMLEVKNAWVRFKSSGYLDFRYDQLFNSKYFLHYGYLGRVGQAVVIATYYEKQREPISMEIVYDHMIDIYVYADGSILTLQEAYKRNILTYDDTIKFKSRSEEYDHFRLRYSANTQ